MRQKRLAELLLPSLLSGLSVSLSQFALLLVPLYFPFLSLLFMVAISGYSICLSIWLGALLLAAAVLGRFFRRLLGISASPVLFVLFTVLFFWGVYIGVIREGTSSVKNVIINTEFALLVVGLYRIYHSDPGIVKTRHSSLNRMDPGTHAEEVMLPAMDGLPQQQSPEEERVRFCKICKAYIKGFDHHCPAFGNCIGQTNHLLFVVLLIGFIIVELSYVACASQFTEIQQNTHAMGLQESISNILPVSTMLFSILQVLWQVVFLFWHFYCICVNIKTDEWINWKKYPEFQFVVPQESGHQFAEVGFRNPYNRGIFGNIQEFIGFV